MPDSASGYVDRGPAAMADIAAEVLAMRPESLRTLALRESFVGLGGSSLDAVRLLALCERKLSRTIDLARLLSLSPLAEVLAETAGCQVVTDPADHAARDDGQQRGVLPGQRDMLQAEVFGGAGSALRQLASAELTGPLDEAALHETLRWIVVRHEALRTVFDRTEKIEFARRVLSACEPQVIRQKWPVAPGGAAVHDIHEQLGRRAELLLEPLSRPPVTFVLTEIGEDHHLLSVVIHHLIADGWTAGLLWREIFEHYQALLAGSAPGYPDGPAPSPDLILSRYAELVESGRLAQLTQARIAQLTGVPMVVELPTELPRPPTIDFRAAQLAFGLSETARHACEDLASRAKVTRTVVMLAAWALVVARRANMSECIIGGTALQRPTADLMNTVASCAASIPIRCAFPGRQPAGDYLRAMSHALSDAVAAADVPFSSLVSGLGAAGDNRRVPLVQVMFSAYDEYIPVTLQAADLQVTFHEGYCGGTGVDVSLFIRRWDSAPSLLIEYTTSVLSPAEAVELAQALDEVLSELACHYDDPLSLVRAWSGSPAHAPR